MPDRLDKAIRCRRRCLKTGIGWPGAVEALESKPDRPDIDEKFEDARSAGQSGLAIYPLYWINLVKRVFILYEIPAAGGHGYGFVPFLWIFKYLVI